MKGKRKNKATRPARPSQTDVIIEGVVQDFTHLATEDITRQRAVYACEATALDEELMSLQTRLAKARMQRAEVHAKLLGLTAIIARR